VRRWRRRGAPPPLHNAANLGRPGSEGDPETRSVARGAMAATFERAERDGTVEEPR